MTILTDIQETWDNLQQIRIAIEVSSDYRTYYNVLKALDAKVDGYIASTEFDNIPVDLKQALNAYRQLLKTFLADVEANLNVMDFINWEPQ